MLLNVTQSRLVIGRFTILPGEKVPAFALTDTEAKAVRNFQTLGFLAEKEQPKQPAPSRKARESGKSTPKAEAKAESLPIEPEKPAPAAEGSDEHKGE